MNEDKTLFQQLVDNREVDQMLNDLLNLESLIPDDGEMKDVQQWGLAVSFTPEDVPRMVEELEEISDDKE